MIEAGFSLLLIAYCVIGFIYSIRVQNNKSLREAYGPSSNESWDQFCHLLGLGWPGGPLVTWILRRGSDDAGRVRSQTETSA